MTTTNGGGESPQSEGGGGGGGRTVEESLTDNSSVEYFLLEPGSAGGSRRSRRGSRAGTMLPPDADGEILSPISHREVVQTPQQHTPHQRIYFEEEEDDQDDEDELTLPLVSTSQQTPRGRPRIRSSSSNFFTRRALRTELSGLNYLNAVAYLAHFVGWYGVAVAGWLGHRRHEYETLVTPSHWNAHYLWVPVLVLEAVFAIAQLLPHYRTRPVVSATGFFFFYTVLLQIAFTFLYRFGLLILSFVALVATLVALLSLLVAQHYQEHHHGNSREGAGEGGAVVAVEYALFRLPFFLHAGWVIIMSVDHFALLFRRYAAQDPALQLGVDLVALAVLLPIAVAALLGPARDFVIPSVILWSYIGVACRLQHPSAVMMDLYGPVVIKAVHIATYFFIGVVGCCVIPVAVVVLAREFCTINVVELD